MRNALIAMLVIFALTAAGCAQTVATAAQPDDGAEAELKAAAEEAKPAADGVNDTTDETNAASDESELAPADTIKDGYYFDYNGTPVYLGDLMTNVLTSLGAENEFYEAPSCAYDGMAKMYVYGGFELATYVRDANDADRLYSLTFFDDSVTTAEGAYIGQSFDDVTALYGGGYEEIPGAYLYSKDGAVLSFTVEDGEVTVIQYYVQDIYG
jgi:hypothetical protein